MSNITEIKPDDIPAYSIEAVENITELNTIGYLLKHKKTGANIVLLSNDDDNKVFNIAFRTPPENDTGLPHILEHSVLCGSRKYPSKNPFEELAQGSLNTFLNAVTYPDKTMYPIASCNDKDFKNLMDVYLDAVFHPNIYTKPEIFKQEGWHYELSSKDDRLKYNGVVYNEMKGALSEPSSMLEREIESALFPDTCYYYESGGKPQAIPELSYEEFLDYHRKYYHPSNSFIYLYGDMDMAERLCYLDKEYLGKYERLDIDSFIENQKPFDEIKYIEKPYPIGNDEDDTDKGYLSYGVLCGSSLDTEEYYALGAVSYALIGCPGAPIKEALIDAGIGKSVSGGDTSLSQIFFRIHAKNVDVSKRDEFVRIIDEKLNQIVKNGIDKKALKAALNIDEFRYREADYGSYPKGLYYSLYVYDSWLYDEKKPFINIKAAEIFEKLNKKLETDYYERLIEKYFIKNNHKVIFSFYPKKGLEEETEKKIQEKLDEYRKTLDESGVEGLIAETKALEEYQSEPSSKEDMEKLPILEISDIRTEPKPYRYEKRQEEVPVVFTDIFTNGIGYLNLSFECKYVPKKLIPYIGLLTSVLTYMDTENYKYSDLNNEINIHSGGISRNVFMYEKYVTDRNYSLRFEMEIKAFYREMPFAFKILEEILLHTNVDNEKRLKEIIAEGATKFRQNIISQGHAAALYRALSYQSESDMIMDIISGGIGTYEYYHEWEKNFDFKEITDNLKKVMRLIFNKENLTINYIADEEGYRAMKPYIHDLTDSLYTDELILPTDSLPVRVRNEAFIIPSPASYTARVGNFIKAGYEYTGTLLTLKNALDYGYLWNNVRVLGGAYGVMSRYGRNTGNMAYMSYRDPNVLKTSETFLSVPEYLKDFEADEREIRKYIIGAIRELDTPMTPKTEGDRAFAAYITGRTDEALRKEREEILSLSVDKIRQTAPLIEAVLKQNYICTVGNREKIMEAKELFGEIRDIFE